MLTDSQKETLGQLGTIQAIISKVDPVLQTTDVDYWSFGKSDMDNFTSSTPNFSNGGSPIGFLVNLFSIVGSYDSIINFMTKYIVYALPALEIAVKGVLLTNLKGMMVCNTDPRIPASLRKEPDQFEDDNSSLKGKGVYISINSIDYSGMLSTSPLTTEGSKFYFGTYTEGEKKLVKKDWKDYTAKEKLKFIKSGGQDTSFVRTKMVTEKNFVGPYELARAADFNAFIWFAVHKAYFPSPIVLNTTQKTISQAFTDIGALSVEKLKLSGSQYIYDGSANNTLSQFKMTSKKGTLPGTTMVEKKVVGSTPYVSKTLSMCYKTEQSQENGSGDTITTSYWAPVSNDWNSANWYTEPDNYYSYNISLPKAKRKMTDYNKMKPVLNLQYVNGDSPSNITDTYGLIVTVPPKAFRAFTTINIDFEKVEINPLLLTFLGDRKNISVLPSLAIKITFDENGNPDPNGHFSLPNTYLKNGDPYVRKETKITDDKCTQAICAMLNDLSANGTFTTSGTTGASNVLTSLLNSKSEVDGVISSWNWLAIGCKADLYIQIGADSVRLSDGFVDSPARLKRTNVKDLAQNMLNYFTTTSNFATPYVNGGFTTKDVEDYEHDGVMGILSKIVSDGNILLKQIKNNKEADADSGDYLVYDVGDGNDGCKLYVKKYQIGPGTPLSSLRTEYFLSSGNTIDKNMSSAFTHHMQECYPGSTVYELNYDMVMGMKLFDAKVIAESLVNSLFNIDIGMGISIPTREKNEVAEEVREIIREIIDNNEETVITDCFFTFSNDRFSSMLEKTELQYLRRKDLHSPSRYIGEIDTDKLNEILAEFDENGTLVEQEEVIGRFFRTAGEELADTIDEDMTDTDRQHVQVRFATNLLGALAGCLITSILSPKVMLIYQMNRAIMQGDISYKNISFKDFFRMMKNIIVAMIREIVELIIKEMLAFLVKLIKKMVEIVGWKLIKEQIDNFKELYRQLISCIGNISLWFDKRQLIDTVLPQVTYADIAASSNSTGTDEPLIIDNC